MNKALNLTGNTLKPALIELLSPELETLVGKLEVASELTGVEINVSANSDDGLNIQSNDPRASKLVEDILHTEVRT